MAVDWLPSERRWIEQLTERVLDGEILLVRALPRWGITAVCGKLADSFGASAVHVDGRSATEEAQKSFREDLDSNVSTAIERNGTAQVLFDNYGRAIRRSQGGHLHSALYRMLVDSPSARDTGALLTARPNDSLDLNFAGSPLMSRARAVLLPTIERDDAEAIGVDLRELKVLCGESTWLARRMLVGGLRHGRADAGEHLTHDRHRIVQTLPSGAVELLAGSPGSRPLETNSREALLCLGYFDPRDEFNPAVLVDESGIIDEVRMQNPAWPATLNESAERFADLLAGAEYALWVDRYMFSEPAFARRFLDRLRAHTATRLRLLVSDDPDRTSFAQSIATALDGVEGIEVRFMHYADRRLLHDRHLVLSTLDTGYVLPMASVILADADPGTAVAARIPPVNYTDYWSRADRVFPRT